MSIFIKYSKVPKDNGINKKQIQTTHKHTHMTFIQEINKTAENVFGNTRKILKNILTFYKSNRNT